MPHGPAPPASARPSYGKRTAGPDHHPAAPLTEMHHHAPGMMSRLLLPSACLPSSQRGVGGSSDSQRRPGQAVRLRSAVGPQGSASMLRCPGRQPPDGEGLRASWQWVWPSCSPSPSPPPKHRNRQPTFVTCSQQAAGKHPNFPTVSSHSPPVHRTSGAAPRYSSSKQPTRLGLAAPAEGGRPRHLPRTRPRRRSAVSCRWCRSDGERRAASAGWSARSPPRCGRRKPPAMGGGPCSSSEAVRCGNCCSLKLDAEAGQGSISGCGRRA